MFSQPSFESIAFEGYGIWHFEATRKDIYAWPGQSVAETFVCDCSYIHGWFINTTRERVWAYRLTINCCHVAYTTRGQGWSDGIDVDLAETPLTACTDGLENSCEHFVIVWEMIPGGILRFLFEKFWSILVVRFSWEVSWSILGSGLKSTHCARSSVDKM